ncbi:MAG: DUF2141 domain-containing protein [Nannocystaceae bacterium]
MVVVLWGCEASASPGETPRPSSVAEAETGTVRVEVSGLESTSGGVIAYLYGSKDDFPTEFSNAFRTRRIRELDGSRLTVRFKNVPHGTYAVVIVHDENGNGTLDRTMIGFPKEGVGASNTTKGRPKWDKAKFVVDGDTKTTVTMQYM